MVLAEKPADRWIVGDWSEPTGYFFAADATFHAVVG